MIAILVLTVEITSTIDFLSQFTMTFQKLLTSTIIQLYFSDDTFREFFSPCLLREEKNATFNTKIFSVNREDPIYEAGKKYFERKREEELDAVDSFEKNKKAEKRKLQDVENKINHYLDPRKTKTIIDFNDRESASIKSFAEKKKKRDKSNN